MYNGPEAGERTWWVLGSLSPEWLEHRVRKELGVRS